MTTHPASRGPRAAEAARNDDAILRAAHSVFMVNPSAPIAEVARRANVGIGALYRRYSSKRTLLQHLYVDSLDRFLVIAGEALKDDTASWDSFVRFMHDGLEVESSFFTARLGGAAPDSPEIDARVDQCVELTRLILERTIAAGHVRTDVNVVDISLIFEQLHAVQVATRAGDGTLARRHLALFLDGLRAVQAPPLPGPAPRFSDLADRYQ